jgi:hypothetical protein
MDDSLYPKPVQASLSPALNGIAAGHNSLNQSEIFFIKISFMV